jgi:DNA processing protein
MDDVPVSFVSPRAAPVDEAGGMAWLRLARSRRVGPATFARLLAEHGSAEASLAALPRLAAASGVSGYAPAPLDSIEAEWRAGFAAGAAPLFRGAPGYPEVLARAADAPAFLWALGDPAIAARPAVALVGARNASALGRRMAARLAGELGAAGITIVSGLARGIDAAAHEASLATGSIAAVAGGVDVVYPPENAPLAARLAAEGLILSEMPMGYAPKAQDFPRRNRIISGLSIGVVVVEGAERPGSLITARNALDQGRDVMATPGSPLDPRAGGCNQLIRDGATLVRSGADVIEAISAGLAAAPPTSRQGRPSAAGRAGPGAPAARPQEAPPDADGLAGLLLDLIGGAPTPEDLLIRTSGAGPAAVAAALVELELAGQVSRHPGGLVSRAA